MTAVMAPGGVALPTLQAQLQQQDEVTVEEIVQFKHTLLARRFPGLRALSDADIKTLIVADRKASGRKLEAEHKLYPKTQFLPPSPKRGQPSDAPAPFVPASRTQAKDDISLQPCDRFISAGPYDSHRADFNEDRLSDESKRSVKPFMPTQSLQAKDTIKVKYFMYSAIEPLPPRTRRRATTTARKGEAQPDKSASGGDAASGHNMDAGSNSDGQQH